MTFSIEKISGFVNSRPVACLFLILALSFTLRVSRCFLVGRVDKDSVMYMAIAEGLAHEDFKYAFELNTRIPPLYIFGLAAGEKLGIGARIAGMIISTFAGAMLPLAIFIIAIKLFRNSRMALLAALLVTVHPFLIRMSADVMRDSLFTSTYAFALAFAACGVSSNKIFSWNWAASGFFAGLAAMTRSEGMEVLFEIVIWFGFSAFLVIRNFKEVRSLIIRGCAAGFIFIFVLGMTTLPVEFILRNSSSEWSAMDKRIFGYFRTFFEKPNDVILRGKVDPE